METVIRPIEPGDDPIIARIIRDTLAEFGANHRGTVYYDPTTDHLSELFKTPRSVYNIALLDGEIIGGAGIYPTAGLPEDMCELVKMYLLPKGRGIGLGKQLIGLCIRQAREQGFRQIYLETMDELKKALSVYEQFGFQYLKGPMGNSGHFGCSQWMIRSLEH